MNPQYRIRKLIKMSQRMTSWVAFGFVLVLGSHWFQDPEERAYLRDTGSAIVGLGVARWMAQQGKRRKGPDGKQIRTPTLKIPPETVDQMEQIWDHRKDRNART